MTKNQLKHQQEKPKENQNKLKQENNSASSVKNRQQTLYLWKKSLQRIAIVVAGFRQSFQNESSH